MIIPDLGAGLSIQYRPHDSAAKNQFTMELQPDPDRGETAWARALATRAAGATQTRPTAEVQEFSGVVTDSGAPEGIPNTAIAVVRLHSAENTPVVELHTDAHGHFSAELPPGDYVAAFVRRGWQTRVQAVTINPAAKRSEMQVPLQLGGSTT